MYCFNISSRNRKGQSDDNNSHICSCRCKCNSWRYDSSNCGKKVNSNLRYKTLYFLLIVEILIYPLTRRSALYHYHSIVFTFINRKNIESAKSTRTSKDMAEPPKDYFDSICMDNVRYTTSNGLKSHAVISTLKNSGDFCSFTGKFIDNRVFTRNDTNASLEIQAKHEENKKIISYSIETANIHHSEYVLQKNSASSYSIFQDHVNDNMKAEKHSLNVERYAEFELCDVMEQSWLSGNKRITPTPPVGQRTSSYATNWTAIERYLANKVSERRDSSPKYEVAIDGSRYTRTNKLPRI